MLTAMPSSCSFLTFAMRRTSFIWGISVSECVSLACIVSSAASLSTEATATLETCVAVSMAKIDK